jgi:hypothetical protein
MIKSKNHKTEQFWREYMLDTAEWLKKSGLSELRVKIQNQA